MDIEANSQPKSGWTSLKGPIIGAAGFIGTEYIAPNTFRNIKINILGSTTAGDTYPDGLSTSPQNIGDTVDGYTFTLPPGLKNPPLSLSIEGEGAYVRNVKTINNDVSASVNLSNKGAKLSRIINNNFEVVQLQGNARSEVVLNGKTVSHYLVNQNNPPTSFLPLTDYYLIEVFGGPEIVSKLSGVVDAAISQGVPKNRLILSFSAYNNIYADGNAPGNEAVKKLATDKGVLFSDVWGRTKAGVKDNYGSNLLQVNKKGQAAVYGVVGELVR